MQVEQAGGKTATIGNVNEIMSAEDVAAMLGVAVKTVQNWSSQRKIPFVRIGRRNVYRRSSIDAWITQKEVSPWQLRK